MALLVIVFGARFFCGIPFKANTPHIIIGTEQSMADRLACYVCFDDFNDRLAA